MILTGDYHTHTKYSHGKGTVLENALVAKKIGLKEIAITDHGFSHPAFGLRKRKLSSLDKDVLNAQKETGVKIYRGMESNIISDDGKCDLTEKHYDDFDIFIAGIHQFVLYRPKTLFSLFLPNYFTGLFHKNPSSRLIKENTKTFINLIKKNPIDVITHINFKCFADAVEVAKVASDYNTFIELNAKKTHLTDEEVFKIAETGVKFIIDSDAHSPDRVGEVSLVEDLLKRVPIKKEQIVNIDGKIPNFRFTEFKSLKGR
jgi:putative hydrolase